jgi:DNA-directed RNA polymerase specialized sigma24 family protein
VARVTDWERAFRALLAARGGALRSYAYLLTGDPTTATDLVQEALTRVFGRGRIGRDIDQLEAYVRRAMLNQYVDSRRRLKRWRTKCEERWQRSRQGSGPVSSCATTKT